MVTDLIDESTASWKGGLVKATFVQEDAAVIISIPIGGHARMEFWEIRVLARQFRASITVVSENYYGGLAVVEVALGFRIHSQTEALCMESLVGDSWS